MTMTRDEYVAHLKGRLDRWNSEFATWEGKAKSAREDVRKRYEEDLVELRARREKALYQIKLLEGASATAWKDLTRGADEAWDLMSNAFAKARGHFGKS